MRVGLSGLALVVGIVACGLSILALTRPLPAPQPCDCKADPAIPAALQVQNQRLARLETQPPIVRPAPVAPITQGAAPGEAPPRPAEPRYARFHPPSPALEVKQAEDGSLAVFNTDPALTGQVVTMRAETEDGEEQTITVTVPPP